MLEINLTLSDKVSFVSIVNSSFKSELDLNPSIFSFILDSFNNWEFFDGLSSILELTLIWLFVGVFVSFSLLLLDSLSDINPEFKELSILVCLDEVSLSVIKVESVLR